MRFATTLLFILAAAALLVFFQWTTPTYAVLTGPLETAGSQDETVASKRFAAKVDKVFTAKALTYHRFGRDYDRQTDGRWLVVTIQLEALQETMPMNAATIEGASGRLYRQSSRTGDAPQLFIARDLQPGLPARGIFIFELPDAETQRMDLILSEQRDPQLDAQVRISLDTARIEARDTLEIGDDRL